VLQPAAVVTLQLAPTQQAPVLGGCGQGFGEQVVSLPWYALPAPVQAASVETVHAPLAAQQAPVAGGTTHGLGEQLELSP